MISEVPLANTCELKIISRCQKTLSKPLNIQSPKAIELLLKQLD